MMVQSVERLPGKHKALSLSFLVKSQEWQCTLTVPNAGKTRSLGVLGWSTKSIRQLQASGRASLQKAGCSTSKKRREAVFLFSCAHALNTQKHAHTLRGCAICIK